MCENTYIDIGKLGYREIDMAVELLQHIYDIDDYSEPLQIGFNPNSGYVFLVDADYNTWMMNDDKLEKWFYCSECGYEGFAEDLIFERKPCCLKYLYEIKELNEDDMVDYEYVVALYCHECDELIWVDTRDYDEENTNLKYYCGKCYEQINEYDETMIRGFNENEFEEWFDYY